MAEVLHVSITTVDRRRSQNPELLPPSKKIGVGARARVVFPTHGVVDYLIKPFQFSRFQEALQTYREEHQITAKREALNQSELDNLIRRSHNRVTPDKTRLPKGLTRLTLQSVWGWIKQRNKQSFSTEDLANEIGISRVSCRKYLVYMAENLLYKGG